MQFNPNKQVLHSWVKNKNLTVNLGDQAQTLKVIKSGIARYNLILYMKKHGTQRSLSEENNTSAMTGGFYMATCTTNKQSSICSSLEFL